MGQFVVECDMPNPFQWRGRKMHKNAVFRQEEAEFGVKS